MPCRGQYSRAADTGSSSSPTKAASQQLHAAILRLGREQMLAEETARRLTADIRHLTKAADAVKRLNSTAADGRPVTDETLADLETVARLAFREALRVSFPEILAEFLDDPRSELLAAQYWARDTSPEDLGRDVRFLPEQVIYHLGMIDYLRHREVARGD